ncbi:hypothetical protein FQA39_LY04358 [Lamprigera yunnana]|nr:hypothetical protein FQA39_LY04358 [Lamprigera yunnana]
MEQLYMFEIFIKKLVISTEVPPEIIPRDPENLKIGLVFSDLINADIVLKDIRDFLINLDDSGRVFDLNIGKSFLFSCRPGDLQRSINKSPLELNLTTNIPPYVIGKISTPWDKTFLKFLENTEKTKTSPPVESNFELVDEENIKTANIEALLRFSAHGQNIQVQFQCVDRIKPITCLHHKKFLFKNINTSTVFKAQIYNDTPDEERIGCAKTVVTRKKLSGTEHIMDEELKKILCKGVDCSGTKKFADLGLGPAYPKKDEGLTNVVVPHGLRHVYGKLEDYGPNSTFSRPKNLEEPFCGKTNDDFDSEDYVDAIINFLKQESSLSCTEYTSGSDSTMGNNLACMDRESMVPYVKSLTKSADKVSTFLGQKTPLDRGIKFKHNDDVFYYEPLRLKGGALGHINKPTPLATCEDLLESYDRVLKEYREVLQTSPLGNQVLGTRNSLETEKCITPTALRMKTKCVPVSACGTSQCPYSRLQSVNEENNFQRIQLKSACGQPNCPFIKKRTGTAHDEEWINLQLKHGDRSNPCGVHNCPYISPCKELPLEPIHWNCPNPLPKEGCKSTGCPLKDVTLYNPVPAGPCGSTLCPYAPMLDCGNSHCPFRPPCPRNESDCPVHPNCDNSCEYPVCPNYTPCPDLNICETCGGTICSNYIEPCDSYMCPNCYTMYTNACNLNNNVSSEETAISPVCSSRRSRSRKSHKDHKKQTSKSCKRSVAPCCGTCRDPKCPGSGKTCGMPVCPSFIDGCKNPNWPGTNQLCGDPRCRNQIKPCGDPRCLSFCKPYVDPKCPEVGRRPRRRYPAALIGKNLWGRSSSSKKSVKENSEKSSPADTDTDTGDRQCNNNKGTALPSNVTSKSKKDKTLIQGDNVKPEQKKTSVERGGAATSPAAKGKSVA